MSSVVSLVTLPHQNHVNMDPTMNEMTAVKTTCIIFSLRWNSGSTINLLRALTNSDNNYIHWVVYCAPSYADAGLNGKLNRSGNIYLKKCNKSHFNTEAYLFISTN